MRRRRSLPWIHRWSRPAIGAIAIAGALLTAYLTTVKFSGNEVIGCSADAARAAGSCKDVLQSDYATIFGLPLSLFGFLAYTSMAVFALAPLALDRDKNRKFRSQLENSTWLLLLAGATAMAVFSGYLMYVLAYKIGTLCLYCITSALFSLTLLTLTVIGREWEDLGQIFFTGITIGVLTLVGTLGIYSGIDNIDSPAIAKSDRVEIPKVTQYPKKPYGWEITTKSGKPEIELAKHLKEKGFTMYGAYWCPHCFEQKQLFGKEAFKEINYVECDPEGKSPQPNLCKEKGIKSYPSWEIKGKIEPGIHSLDELAKSSDYQGSTNFKYTMPGL